MVTIADARTVFAEESGLNCIEVKVAGEVDDHLLTALESFIARKRNKLREAGYTDPRYVVSVNGFAPGSSLPKPL